MFPEDAPRSTDYRALAARMGYASLRRRLKKQALLWARETHQGAGIFVLEAILPVDRILAGMLRLAHLDRKALSNYLDIRIVRNEIHIPGLPTAFDGFTILQLADLHCDLHPAFAGRLVEKIDGLVFDLAVFTGDYHNKIAEPHEDSLRHMQQIVAAVHPPRFAILGNHDFIEMVAYLEHVGLPVLLNEATAIERSGASLWLAGIDDPHFFRSDDLVRARARIPAGAPAILLSHSPETYHEAARLGFSAMLCGHTHGGQICLPGGIPLIRNTRAPRRFLAGPWGYRSLSGYTSRGTGSSGVPARLFCPPEITLHTLRGAS